MSGTLASTFVRKQVRRPNEGLGSWRSVENEMKTVRDQRIRRHRRVRKHVAGSAERPRLAVFRSNRHLYAQLIDDADGRTLVSVSTVESSLRSGPTGNATAASRVGELVAERALEKGIRKVVFDRGGFLFHGKLKALADAAREKGLEF